ncbi:MAG TPA: hypothetical protein VGE88_14490 [Lysobacter sp.]
MPDTFPSRRQLLLGVIAIALLATLGSFAVRTRAADECRYAVSQATTPYKVEQVLRSASCLEAHGDGRGD